MNYLQIIISIILHFIRTKAKDGLSEEFVKDVFSLNVAATEFLEFLIKNINDSDFLINNTDFINSTILNSLKYYLEQPHLMLKHSMIVHNSGYLRLFAELQDQALNNLNATHQEPLCYRFLVQPHRKSYRFLLEPICHTYIYLQLHVPLLLGI